MKNIILSLLIFLLVSCCSYKKEVLNIVHDTSIFADTVMDLPPSWSFGVTWGGYTSQIETIERIDSIIMMDLPIDAYHIDSWFWDYENMGAGPDGYIDFVGDTVHYPDMKGMWDYMEDNHIKSGIWVWNMMHETGNEAHYVHMDTNNWYVKKKERNTKGWHNKGASVYNPIKGEYFKDSKTIYADFTQEGCYNYYQQNFRHFFDKGLDYVKLDNHTHVPYMDVFYTMTQNFGLETKGRGYIMTHAWHGDDEQKANFKKYPIKWSDDTEIAWKDSEEGKWPHGGIIDNVEAVTIGKMSDIPFFTIDAGGFNYSKKYMKSEFVGATTDNQFGGGGFNEKLTIPIDTELYMRWMQFANFLPVMQIFCGSEVPTSHLPWRHNMEAYENFKMLTHLRMQLFPYIYSYAHNCIINGGTMISADSSYKHQYLFGDELLVAPVVIKGATTKEVYLPKGQWIDFWTSENYEGNQEVIIDAPVNTIPLFVRSGSIIPMRPYHANIESGSKEELILNIYPGEQQASFRLIEDDGLSEDYKNGIFAITDISFWSRNKIDYLKIESAKGYFEGMPDSKNYIVKLRSQKKPSKVMGANAEWKYDNKIGMLTIKFSGKVKEELNISIKY